MEEVHIQTPLGTVKICGNNEGIVEITFLNEEQKTSKTIPKLLEKTVLQLNEYFNVERTEFPLKLNPQGTTPFQKEVWQDFQ